jgi:HD-like signal output (HDOD) protein
VAVARQEKISECVKSLTGKPDFPVFSQHVQAILAAVDAEQSARELTRLIVHDYSLTLKVLLRANAYNVSGRPILSVTHAVVMLGTEAVRHIAAGLLIFEHFHNKPAGVKELMTLSILSANHVREIAAARLPRVALEEAYLCGMTRNLGEILVAYYLPHEYAEILRRVRDRPQPLDTACEAVLEFSFEDLGEAVSRYWGMPDRVVACQRAAVPIAGPTKSPDLLMDAVSLGHLMTTAAYRMQPQAGATLLKLCLEDHYPWLRLTREDVDEILQKAIDATRKSFEAMDVRIGQLRLEEQTRKVLEAMAAAGPKPAQPIMVLPPAADDTLERLTAEVCGLVESGSSLDLNTLILMVLEAIYRGAGFERVIFAFVNPERTQIEGRIGLGDGVDKLIRKFKFRMSMSGGPVATALLCRRSVVVDSRRNEVNQLTRTLGCKYLGLYTLAVEGPVVGCIYMESRNTHPKLDSSQYYLLDRLRDVLVGAIARLRREARAGSG